MPILRFTLGAGLIVVAVLLLAGAAALALALAVGEVAETPRELARLGLFLLFAGPCAYGGYRLLRTFSARQTPQQH